MLVGLSQEEARAIVLDAEMTGEEVRSPWIGSSAVLIDSPGTVVLPVTVDLDTQGLTRTRVIGDPVVALVLPIPDIVMAPIAWARRG